MNAPRRPHPVTHTAPFFFALEVGFEFSEYFCRIIILPFSLLCMKSTSYVFSFRMVFFYFFVTTGWIFDIRLMYGHIYSKSMDQPGKVASPARGQLNRENEYFPVRVRSCLRIWSRETGSAVPSRVSLLISILRLNMVLTYGIPPEFRGGVHLFIYD